MVSVVLQSSIYWSSIFFCFEFLPVSIFDFFFFFNEWMPDGEEVGVTVVFTFVLLKFPCAFLLSWSLESYPYLFLQIFFFCNRKCIPESRDSSESFVDHLPVS